ncbi:MAG TPA: UDP-N-acetylmuramoyl-L-alanine--D-glutamate ligase [Oscillatoriaceae cyanobacterium M33_DOE_052]|uniref:UDP-N-acetylmuramoylalanine--D-glutamate ligase n=1 Tax=Planktothricoides sp. SpSt-374 TaxID=2282167 RepID=A0A7C3ZMH0_9CYAN|nr:UDP-N-acetylmuramoyl-L-alanine--D-glutamate ligase [Oscillatoriaceae cyanobacterium M33_DOE_052]
MTKDKAHIIGLGKSGIAAARLLKIKGWNVTISDASSNDSLREQQQELTAEGIEVLLGHSFAPEADLQLVVVSPGVPWDVGALVRSREMGIETIGEMELAWRHLNHIPWVAITGTNGKTTTTALIAAIFQTAGLHAPACGNIGYAACELAIAAATGKTPDWVIAEISSYQIESSSTLSPRIGLWTTFTPDHLKRHRTLENYFRIKASLLEKSEIKIFNGDDPYLRHNAAQQIGADAIWTSVNGKDSLPVNPEIGVYIQDDWVVAQGKPIVRADALRMPGGHNRQNLLMAVAAATAAGIDPEAIATAVANFNGVSHRLELIRTWQGIDFINDSKATNYDAAEVGLSAVVGPVILIAGGDPKEGDDTAWLQAIKAKCAAVLLIGDAAPAFAQRFAEVGITEVEIVETMARAVPRSAELAQQKLARVVLLSPACASFDQYQNFEQRGDHFRQLTLEGL